MNKIINRFINEYIPEHRRDKAREEMDYLIDVIRYDTLEFTGGQILDAIQDEIDSVIKKKSEEAFEKLKEMSKVIYE